MHSKQFWALLLCLVLVAAVFAPAMLAAESSSAPSSASASSPCTDSEVSASDADSVCPSQADGVSSSESCNNPSESDSASSIPLPDSIPASPSSCASACDTESASTSADAPAESTESSCFSDPEQLYRDLLNAQNLAQADAMIAERDPQALRAWTIDHGQWDTLVSHLNQLLKNETPMNSATVTNAGPLLPPIYTGSRAKARATSQDPVRAGKTATQNSDGSITLRLETYATGAIQENLSFSPVDLVLVLDQSGSMTYDFDGNPDVPETESRQYALKQAVKSFIQDISAKYSAETDHRIALVTFDSGAQILQNWTDATSAGAASLIHQVDLLPASPYGSTNTAAGMALAQQLMGPDYNYHGGNSRRQQAVILLTDGAPTTDNQFSVDVANRTLAYGGALKQQGVTLYSMGIFNGANPAQLYGESGYNWNSDGSVGSIWATTQTWWGGIADCDIPAENRFLNFLSSNYQDASSLGAQNFYDQQHNPPAYGWQITENFSRTAAPGNEYYLTAHDPLGLARIFTEISKQVADPDTLLNKRSVIRDVMTPYFTLPDSSEVHLYTADSLDGTAFAAAVPLTDSAVSVSVDPVTRTVSVSGFDFGHNFVSEQPRTENAQPNFYGRELIIEFTVHPRPGFLGGNNVPTNQDISGLYLPDTPEGPGKAIALYPVPQVNVSIPELSLAAPDAYTYLGTDPESLRTPLMQQYDFHCGSQAIDLAMANDPTQPYGLAPWQTAFVAIHADAFGFQQHGFMTQDTAYTTSVSVSPHADAAPESQGTPAIAAATEATGQIRLLTPVITWKDSWMDLHQTADYPLFNFVSLQWIFEGQTREELIAGGNLVLGSDGILDYGYSPAATDFLRDTPVKVRVYLAGFDITDYVKFIHQPCTVPGCLWDTPGFTSDNCQFIVHIRTVDLTIQKQLSPGNTSAESFVFRIESPELDAPLQVTVQGSSQVVITGLAPGSYTITETDWSWRYNQPARQTIQLDSSETITFTNMRNSRHWLSGEALCENLWNGDQVHRIEQSAPAKGRDTP